MRRLFHIITGILLVLIVAYLDKRRGIIFLSTLFVIAIIFETVRLSLPYFNRIFFHHLNPLLRAEEKSRPTGAGYYLGGILLSLLLFKYEIALFSMTILAVGDPVASVTGKRFGRYYIRGKSLEGAIGFFMASMGAGFILNGLWAELPIGIMITGVIAGTLSELLSNKINDNFLIPIVAAGTMEAVLSLLNLFKLY